MYAVFKLGSNQHRAQVGDVIKVQKLQGDIGDKVEINKVMMLKDDQNVVVGTPYVENAKVVAEIVQHGRDKKILILKYKRRKHYRRRKGHRQHFTKVKIVDIIPPWTGEGEKKEAEVVEEVDSVPPPPPVDTGEK